MIFIKLLTVQILSLFLLVSCSLSSIKTGSIKNDDVREVKPVDLAFSLKRLNHENTNQSKIMGDWFLDGLVWGEDRYQRKEPQFLVNKNSECKVDVNYKYDGGSYSSWKTWLSGGTLFIVPVKFKTDFQISITKGKQIENKVINMESWISILFLPVSPFMTSDSEMIKLIGQSIRHDVYKLCSETALNLR